MYLKTQQSSISAKNFVILQIQLEENDLWVIMANLIPWKEFEGEYAEIFDEKLGAPPKL